MWSHLCLTLFVEHPTLLRKDETTAGNTWPSKKIQAQSPTELLGCLQQERGSDGQQQSWQIPGCPLLPLFHPG